MAPNPTSAAIDDVFDIFNIDDDDDDDPFRELDTSLKPLPETSKRKAVDNSDNEDFLGVNEEIKVVKKRKPVPKLDENRLLSQQGIPRLRSGFQSKLMPRLKTPAGRKGYEFDDVTKLLQFYQLWLDNLYPRAKFRDGLAMIEKVGHGKRMQVMRKTWIDQGKRKGGDYMDEEDVTTIRAPRSEPTAQPARVEISNTTEETSQQHPSNLDSIFGDATTTAATANNEAQQIFEDPDSLFLPETNPRHQHSRAPSVPDDADDLDALLAEHDAAIAATASAVQNAAKPPVLSNPQPTTSKPNTDAAADSDPEDDLDALLAAAAANNDTSTRAHPTPLARHHQTPSPHPSAPEEGEDDLDALLAEHTPVPTPNLASAPEPSTSQPETDADALAPLPFSSSQVEDPESVEVDVEGL